MHHGFRLVLFFLLFVAVPTYASADALPAGFAPASVWLSKTNLTGGDSVTVYTVVYDSSASALRADVDFTVNDASIGTKSVSLDAGATQIVSAPWTAVAGTHTISAAIGNVKDANGAELAIENMSAGAITVTVAEPAPPPAAVVALQSAAPIIAGAAKSAYGAAESARRAAADALAGALAESNATSNVPVASNPGEVLGASTENISSNSPATYSGSSFFPTLWRDFLSALLYIAKSQFWFYLTGAIVLYLLYRLARVALGERRYR